MPDPETVLAAVAEVAPEIRAGLPGRRAVTGTENETGDEVTAADVYADELLAERLTALDAVGAYASEEREGVTDAGSGYAVAVDPLDGSSNLRSNNPMGTIVGVYDEPLPAPGRALVAAGFVLFGPVTTMVTAVDGTATEWLVRTGADGAGTRERLGTVEVPADPVVYGFGGREPDWPADVAAHVERVREDLKLRYGGAMIADVSQVLTYGGVFGYPALRSRPAGKLRTLFESAPMAHVVETAGGASTDGARSLLDVEPEAVHDRTPTYLGSPSCIRDVETALS